MPDAQQRAKLMKQQQRTKAAADAQRDGGMDSSRITFERGEPHGGHAVHHGKGHDRHSR